MRCRACVAGDKNRREWNCFAETYAKNRNTFFVEAVVNALPYALYKGGGEREKKEKVKLRRGRKKNGERERMAKYSLGLNLNGTQGCRDRGRLIRCPENYDREKSRRS